MQGDLAQWLEGTAVEVIADEDDWASQDEAPLVLGLLSGEDALLQGSDEPGEPVVLSARDGAVHLVEYDAAGLVVVSKAVVLLVCLLDDLEQALAAANVTGIGDVGNVAALLGELARHRAFPGAGRPVDREVAAIRQAVLDEPLCVAVLGRRRLGRRNVGLREDVLVPRFQPSEHIAVRGLIGQ